MSSGAHVPGQPSDLRVLLVEGVGHLDETAQTVLAKGLGEALGEPVVHDAAFLAVADQAGGAQHAQRVAHAVLTGVEGQSEVTDAKLLNDCLLYTSDAADDLTRVDLGGRR